MRDINTYTYTHTYIYTHTHIDTHTHTYIYIYTHTHIYIYIHTHIYIYIHTHIYIYIHTHIYIYIHTHIYITKSIDPARGIDPMIQHTMSSHTNTELHSEPAKINVVYQILVLDYTILDLFRWAQWTKNNLISIQ